MTRLAFGAKWGRPVKPPVGFAAKRFGLKSEASATPPMPVAARPRNWRRVRLRGSGKGMGSSKEGPRKLKAQSSKLKRRTAEAQSSKFKAQKKNQGQRTKLEIYARVLELHD